MPLDTTRRICPAHGPILTQEQEIAYADDELVRHGDGRCEGLCAVCHDNAMIGHPKTREDVLAIQQWYWAEEDHYLSEAGCICPKSER